MSRGRLVAAYAVFSALVVAVLGICFASGMDTILAGGSRVHRFVQLGALSALSLAFLVHLSRNTAAPALPGSVRAKGLAWAEAGVALFALLAAGVIAVVALRSFPLSGDEGAYTFQADVFATGRLWAVPSAIQPFIEQSYIFPVDGRLISQYPPAWSALLAAAKVAGIPEAVVNPVLGALTVVALWRFVAPRHGRATAAIAAACLAGSAFFLFNSASFYNGTLTALFGVLFVAASCSFLDRPRVLAAVGMGAWLAAIAVTRHFDAFLFALPAGVAFVRQATRQHWSLLPVALAAALPLLGLMFAYYWALTGRPLVFPQTLRNPADGLLGANWHALRVTEIAVGRVVELAEWTSPPFVAAFVWSFVQKLRLGRLRFYDWYGPLFLAGYWMYWADGGFRWGPRYIYPALPFIALVVADYVRFSWPGRTVVRFGHLVAVSVLIALLQVPFLAVRAREIMDEAQDVPRQVRLAGIHNAVVVILSGTGKIWHVDVGDLARNGLTLDKDVVYAHGPGLFADRMTSEDIDRAMAALRPYFPTRTLWRYARDPGSVQGTLSKVGG